MEKTARNIFTGPHVKQLKEVLDKMAAEEQKRQYIIFPDGKRMKKTLIQCIPYTAEKWAEYLRDKADRDNKQLISFIDKVFFEDGGLQFKETCHESINQD